MENEERSAATSTTQSKDDISPAIEAEPAKSTAKDSAENVDDATATSNGSGSPPSANARKTSPDGDARTAPTSTEATVDGDGDGKQFELSDNGRYIYTDPHTNGKFIFCHERNFWLEMNVDPNATKTHGFDEQQRRIRVDKRDGCVEFFDAEKNAWFPDINEDFMAQYQMNYGFVDNTSATAEEQKQKQKQKAVAEEEEKRRQDAELKRMTAEAEAATSSTAAGGKRKTVAQPEWFDMDPQHNTKVYVSNLPLDITPDEFAELMSKCGVVMRDPQTQKYKLKLYAEPDGQLKGDGLCDYMKVESVGLALQILDEYNLRGHKIRVERAKFTMRGAYNPSLRKPKRKKKDKEKEQKMREKVLDWRPEKMRGERSKHEKVVVIKNMFHPSIFEKEVQLLLDYQNKLREECEKCGTVRNVTVFDRHEEGVAQIKMASPEEADLVIQMMHGRFFGKRQLIAEHWDGRTKYKIVESRVEEEERQRNWQKYLESDENKNSGRNEFESLTNKNETTTEKSSTTATTESNVKLTGTNATECKIDNISDQSIDKEDVKEIKDAAAIDDGDGLEEKSAENSASVHEE